MGTLSNLAARKTLGGIVFSYSYTQHPEKFWLAKINLKNAIALKASKAFQKNFITLYAFSFANQYTFIWQVHKLLHRYYREHQTSFGQYKSPKHHDRSLISLLLEQPQSFQHRQSHLADSNYW